MGFYACRLHSENTMAPVIPVESTGLHVVTTSELTGSRLRCFACSVWTKSMRHTTLKFSHLEGGQVAVAVHVGGLGADVDHDALRLHRLAQDGGRQQAPQVQPVALDLAERQACI